MFVEIGQSYVISVTDILDLERELPMKSHATVFLNLIQDFLKIINILPI